MPVIRQMLGPWTELEANAWFLPASLISLLLLYTWFNRVPEAGAFWRVIWRWGRWLLASAYLWSLGVLIWLNLPVLLRPDHRHFEALFVLAAIDVAALFYLLRSERLQTVFAEFPEPVDTDVQREADKSKAAERRQFMQEARLSASIAQTAEQEAVEAHWRAEVVKDPTVALPWLELGVLAYQCDKIEQAQALIEQALSCEPQNPVVLRNLCELLRQKGRLSQAIAYGLEAVTIAPKDEIARLNLAQALVADDKTDRAVTEFHRLLDLNPKHIQAWLNLAVLLLKQNRKADALAALDAVFMIEPGNDQAMAIRNAIQ